MKEFGDSNAERNDRKRQSNNKELAMKKIISFLMVIVVSCSCCMLSFAADADSENNNLAKAYIEPRRAELVEVVSANYDCFDGKDYYNHYEYRTYTVPAGKTLISTGHYIDWIKENYKYAGRVWDRVMRTAYTYEIR